jgi:hypothetical protein
MAEVSAPHPFDVAELDDSLTALVIGHPSDQNGRLKCSVTAVYGGQDAALRLIQTTVFTTPLFRKGD